jgi:hypothetical protein
MEYTRTGSTEHPHPTQKKRRPFAPRGRWGLPQLRQPPPPSTPYPAAAAEQRSSGEAWATLAAATCHSPRQGERVGGLPSMAVVLLGRQQSSAAGWRWCVGIERWRRVAERYATVGAAGGRHAQIWATRAPYGLRQAPYGLRRAGALWFMVLPEGGRVASARIGTAAWPVCYISATEALRARLGLAGPAWAWCAMVALSGR